MNKFLVKQQKKEKFFTKIMIYNLQFFLQENHHHQKNSDPLKSSST